MSELEEKYKQHGKDIHRNTVIAVEALDNILKTYIAIGMERGDVVYREEELEALEKTIDKFFFAAQAVETYLQAVDYLTANTLEGGFRDEQRIRKMLHDLGYISYEEDN